MKTKHIFLSGAIAAGITGHENIVIVCAWGFALSTIFDIVTR